MRILFVHPNYRSGGAEIAGTWPPAWVAYLTGHLRQAGFDDIHFIDAMTDGITDAELAQQMEALAPDVVGVTAITPSIRISNPRSQQLSVNNSCNLYALPASSPLNLTFIGTPLVCQRIEPITSSNPASLARSP